MDVGMNGNNGWRLCLNNDKAKNLNIRFKLFALFRMECTLSISDNWFQFLGLCNHLFQFR